MSSRAATVKQLAVILLLLLLRMLALTPASAHSQHYASKNLRLHQQKRLLSTVNNEHIMLSSDEYELENMDDSEDEDDDEGEANPRYDYASDTNMPSSQAWKSRAAYDIFACCSEVFGSCRSACENISLSKLAFSETRADADAERDFRLDLKKYCPSMQVEFWQCINITLEAVAKGAHWSGRRCCVLGLSPHCSNACATVGSALELLNTKSCRQSDEQHMFACFDRQEAGDRCCGNAPSECLQACHEIFEPHNRKNSNQRQYSDGQLLELCGENNTEVLQCIRNVTDLAPLTNSLKYLPCCEYSRDEHCRFQCKIILNTTGSTDIIIAELEDAGCGSPLPHVPLWQCFLTADHKKYLPSANNRLLLEHQRGFNQPYEVSQINEIGIDAAKLHCCRKAQSNKCRRLCMQTYTNKWIETRSEFETSCIMQPQELELRQCLDQVEEPCELGCDGLNFCTNFNNRPTELFRSCKPEADVAAKSDLQLWQQQGSVQLLGMNFPIKNITKCAPAKWQAIACALQLKPCTRQGHYNHICVDDCYEVLSECMDWTRLAAAASIESICSHLRPQSDEDIPCISLRPYLEQSDVPQHTGGHHGLSAPCRAHPCNASEICVPLRNGTNGYKCLAACNMGEASSYMVPQGSYVKIPVANGERLNSLATASFKVCRCAANGRIENCQPLPSFEYENCILPGGKSIKHGSTFFLECNICSCYAAEITCTKRQCRFPGYTDAAYTSLPCNCPKHFVPVCGSNGKTYHSACIAKCLGLQDHDIEYGACAAWNPCAQNSNKCAGGAVCLERRQICLTNMHRPCVQYQCANQTTECEHGASLTQNVCAANQITHKSACSLLNSKLPLAHWNACFKQCSWRGPVCGINGVTYKHECAAWADYILVDYLGSCREVGLLADDMGNHCRTVKCSSLPKCDRVVPPGACCPICAAAFRIIYSRKQIDRALYALREPNRELLSLQNILKELDALIQISECQLSGFLTMEVGIFAAVGPRAGIQNPSRILIEACSREAEKISTLISTQSHQISSNLVLSGLTVSYMIPPAAAGSKASALAVLHSYAHMVLLIMFIMVIVHMQQQHC